MILFNNYFKARNSFNEMLSDVTPPKRAQTSRRPNMPKRYEAQNAAHAHSWFAKIARFNCSSFSVNPLLSFGAIRTVAIVRELYCPCGFHEVRQKGKRWVIILSRFILPRFVHGWYLILKNVPKLMLHAVYINSVDTKWLNLFLFTIARKYVLRPFLILHFHVQK